MVVEKAAKTGDLLPIGVMAQRSGVAVSALRYYEDHGLVTSTRAAGGVRYFERSTLRRIAFIRAAQMVGLTLEEIREAMATLPERRTPTRNDWAQLSRRFRERLDHRIEALRELRDDLTGCIGCGCLSLRSCRLYNARDQLATQGPGPRRLPAHVTRNASGSRAKSG